MTIISEQDPIIFIVIAFLNIYVKIEKNYTINIPNSPQLDLAVFSSSLPILVRDWLIVNLVPEFNN